MCSQAGSMQTATRTRDAADKISQKYSPANHVALLVDQELGEVPPVVKEVGHDRSVHSQVAGAWPSQAPYSRNRHWVSWVSCDIPPLPTHVAPKPFGCGHITANNYYGIRCRALTLHVRYLLAYWECRHGEPLPRYSRPHAQHTHLISEVRRPPFWVLSQSNRGSAAKA